MHFSLCGYALAAITHDVRGANGGTAVAD